MKVKEGLTVDFNCPYEKQRGKVEKIYPDGKIDVRTSRMVWCVKETDIIKVYEPEDNVKTD